MLQFLKQTFLVNTGYKPDINDKHREQIGLARVKAALEDVQLGNVGRLQLQGCGGGRAQRFVRRRERGVNGGEREFQFGQT